MRDLELGGRPTSSLSVRALLHPWSDRRRTFRRVAASLVAVAGSRGTCCVRSSRRAASRVSTGRPVPHTVRYDVADNRIDITLDGGGTARCGGRRRTMARAPRRGGAGSKRSTATSIAVPCRRTAAVSSSPTVGTYFTCGALPRAGARQNDPQADGGRRLGRCPSGCAGQPVIGAEMSNHGGAFCSRRRPPPMRSATKERSEATGVCPARTEAAAIVTWRTTMTASCGRRRTAPQLRHRGSAPTAEGRRQHQPASTARARTMAQYLATMTGRRRGG